MLTAATLRTVIRTAAMLVALVALAGCGDDETGGAGGTDGARLTGPLTYQRTGGVRFVQDRLVVQPDGTGTLAQHQGAARAVRLDDEQLASLEATLGRTDLGAAPADSTSPTPIPDDISHTIEYGGRTVVTEDATLPAELNELVSELASLVGALDKG